MYERFTDRARKAVQNANNVAIAYNHEYIGTEHLLLGLFADGSDSGMAGVLLKELRLDSREICRAVRAQITAAPEINIIGKLPQTPRLKKVFENAMQFSQDLGSAYVGTEHLLLGLIGTEGGVAASVFWAYSCTIEKALEAVLKAGSPAVRSGSVQVEVMVEKVVESLQAEQSPSDVPPPETHEYPIDPSTVTPGVYAAYFRYALAEPGSIFHVVQKNPPRELIMVYRGATGFPRFVTPFGRGEQGAEATDWMRIAKMYKIDVPDSAVSNSKGNDETASTTR